MENCQFTLTVGEKSYTFSAKINRPQMKNDNTVTWLPISFYLEKKETSEEIWLKSCELITEFFIEPEIKPENPPNLETTPKIWRLGSANIKIDQEQWMLEGLYPSMVNFRNIDFYSDFYSDGITMEILWKYSSASIVTS